MTTNPTTTTPNIMSKKYAAGTVITVTIDGRPYETIIDEDGVQCFRRNMVTCMLSEHCENRGMGMNDIARAFHRGQIPLQDYLEFNMALGYSIDNTLDHSAFRNLEVENPLWASN